MRVKNAVCNGACRKISCIKERCWLPGGPGVLCVNVSAKRLSLSDNIDEYVHFYTQSVRIHKYNPIQRKIYNLVYIIIYNPDVQYLQSDVQILQSYIQKI